jgi:hypothetical protein
MLSVVASLALLAAMSALGIGLVRRFIPFLTPLEQAAYGAPIGMVVASLAFLPVGIVLGFHAAQVAGVGASAAMGGAWLLRDVRIAPAAAGGLRALVARVSWLPTLVIGAFVARWALFWRDALQYRADGLWAGHVNIWGDWTVHLGIVSSFAYGQNFPPQHPRFTDTPFGYHFLVDLTAAAMVALGMDPGYALTLHSFILCAIVAVAIYAFARRMTGNPRAAIVALGLFLLGGGLGWLATAARAEAAHDILGTLGTLAWDYRVKSDFNLAMVNMFFGFLASQRAFLYGLPIAFTTLAVLHRAVRRGDLRLFALAGVVAGLLPLAHLGTLLALAMVTPFLFLLFRSRGWFLFHAVWIAVALPQLLMQLGGGTGALAAIRIQLGWVTGPDPWPWFWIKNLGWFIPIVAAGLLGRRYLPPRSRRFMLAFGAIFVATNVVVFQPWDWDNAKFLTYWFLSISIVAGAAIARAWHDHPTLMVRSLLVGAVLSMTMSGLLENLGTALGQSSYRMLDTAQLELAAQVRERTPVHALFMIGMQSHDPIATLTGRRVYVGYANWLWTEGVPYETRRNEVLAVYGGDPGAEAIMAHDRIDFVVVGPYEIKELKADPTWWRNRFPVIASVAGWQVFDVRGLQAGTSLPARGAP